MSNEEVNQLEYDKFETYTSTYSATSILSKQLRSLSELIITEEETKGEQKVLKVDLDNGESAILKYSHFEQGEFSEIVHEAFVGLFVLNNLNLSNFARILGANIKQNCPERSHLKCNYVLYEYIEGVTFAEYMKLQSEDRILSTLLQLYQALNTANALVSFTHYDLHPNNVMVMPNGTPVVIDYGSTHVKYNDTDYGLEIPSAHIYNQSMWFHDVFRLTGNALIVVDREFGDDLYLLQLQDYAAYLEEKIIDLEAKIARRNLIVASMGNAASGFVDFNVMRLEDAQKDLVITQNKLESFQKHLSQRVPASPSSLVIKLRKILSFFDPSFLSSQGLAKYKLQYRYFQPSQEMIDAQPKFDDFIKHVMEII